MTDAYINTFMMLIFLRVFVPCFITCGLVYFIVLTFRKVGGI
jgi:hypothetical protein